MIKRKIIHPYKNYSDADENRLIEVIFELCTIYKSAAYGLALIVYNDPHSEENSFKGLAILESGKIHNTPFIFVTGKGEARFISKMIDGRPASVCF